MSIFHFVLSIGFRSVLFSVVISWLLFVGYPVMGDSFGDPCYDAVSVGLDTSLRGEVDLSGGPRYVKLEISQPGLLAVDVAASSVALLEPVLGYVGGGCGPAAARYSPTVLQRSITHQVLIVHGPGSHLFRVSASDTSRAQGRVRFSTRFVPDSLGSYKNGEDEEEIEIEADGQNGVVQITTRPGGLVSNPWGARNGEDEEEIEIEADGQNSVVQITTRPGALLSDHWGARNGEDEEEIEIEADGHHQAFLDVGRSLYSRYDDLCRRSGVDDHGDSFTCASLLWQGRIVRGSLGNDDVDVFQIVVGDAAGSGSRKVEFLAVGDVELTATLFDTSGQRLEVAGQGVEAAISRMLTPGTYFVRVESPYGSQGSYDLAVETSAW